MPRSLAENIARLAECEEMTGCRLTAESEKNLISLLCDGIPLTVEKTGPMEKAMAASGGVSLKEIDPATMESKLISGLYFAGEVLDVDAFTGGFNIQIALSTGYTAGINA